MQNQKNKDITENNLLRRQIADLQSEVAYTRKFTNMQFEIDLLKQQILELKDENIRLKDPFVKASKEFEQLFLNYFNDIAHKNAIECIEIIKSLIRDKSIYTRIHELEIEDGKNYSDRKSRGA
jgi:hypothetical protein